MTHFWLQNGLAFLEGFALIISPCILPILPIVLAGSIEGGRRRPLGVIFGFVISFAIFTFFSRELAQHSHINLALLRQIAFALIFIFGLILFSDFLSQKFNLITQRLADVGNRLANHSAKPGFLSGFILGLLISLVWVPCGGPILAAAIVQAAVAKTTWQSFFIFFFFALGSVVPMVLIALLGRTLIARFSFLKTQTHLLRKIFAVIIMLSAIYFAVWGISIAATMPEAPNVIPPELAKSNQLIDPVASPFPAPALPNNAVWINSPPLTMESLKGKVVLIDFWTYSCINCVRTLPYLKAWYQRYADKGFVIIGVHAPEFEFEKNFDNVKNAVNKYQITYPVVLDNRYQIWNAYDNRYWPAHYLINKEGQVVAEEFGEGKYAQTEHNIRVLLGINDKSSLTTGQNSALAIPDITPETYLGSQRAENYVGIPELDALQNRTYKMPPQLGRDQWALQGKWQITFEKITAAEPQAAIRLHFYAGKVFAVIGNATGQTQYVKVLLDGQPITKFAGKDVHNSEVTVTMPTLFELIHLPKIKSGVVELQAMAAGTQFYTFTFGD